MIGREWQTRPVAYICNVNALDFIKKHYREAVLLIFIIFAGWFYLTSADNLTNMLSGDGYFHSLIAENILVNEEIEYEWPYRIFGGLKDSKDISHYPVHYSQLFHLTLALFNEVGGLSVFSWHFTLYVDILLCVGTYILFRKMGLVGFLAPLLCVVAVGYRVFAINFMEGYLLLLFVGILWCVDRYYRYKKPKIELEIFYYLAVFLSGLLTITKQIGLVDGITLLGILCLIALFKKDIKRILTTVLLMAGTAFGPLFALYRGIGTLGYGTGSLTLPSFIPFGDTISKLFFTSRYQNLPTYEPRVLAYHVERSIGENVNKISNFFLTYGAQGVVLNWIFLALYAAGLYFVFKKSRSLGLIIIAVLAGEFFVLNWEDLILTQYNIILIYLTSFLLATGLYYLSQRFRLYKKFVPLFLIVLFTISFFTQHSSLYNNVGRNTREMELLYTRMGEYVKLNYADDKSLFLASDPQFGVLASRDYIWYPGLYWGEWDEEFEIITDLYNTKYLVITSTNLKNSGLYDEIPFERYEKIITSSEINLVKRFQNGSNFIELWELSGIN